ncbi:MAG: MBL fold metallo-hydrolase [Verrucomicrobia bacterium]|nr:MBL fold metallo-hydrolase [Verrucomicrobiota bacterium]
MRFINHTRRIEIGANCYSLETAGKRIVLDCGMHPRQEGLEGLPDLDALPDDSVDAVLLTHAHQDHLGSVPVLMRRHPNATLFATDGTRQIGEVMLHNSVNVMLRIRAEQGVASYPLFTHREVDSMIKRCLPVPLRQRWSVEGERLGAREEAPLSFEFFDAGHILGSAGVMVRSEGRTLFYSGDVNFDDQTVSAAARFPEERLDVLVMETTRGDSPGEPCFTRAREEVRFGEALRDALERGGAVLIPVFALGKTQELLAMLAGLQAQRILPRGLPVYIGGLSTKLTEIYDKLAGQTFRLKPDLQLLDSVAPFVVGGADLNALPVKGGRIYALTSGMMTENTLSNLFASRFITDPANSLFFIGYADPNSPGGRIRAGKQGDCVQLDARHPAQKLACALDTFNFSAHASRESIRAWVNKVAPKKIVLVHGDAPAIEWFRQTLSTDLPGSEVIVPVPGEALEL